jgi:aspartate racemase
MSKRIGILGGLTPESTVTYYQHIVHRYYQCHGDKSYPEIVIYSVSFQQFEDWMEAEEWEPIFKALLDGLCHLRDAGADFAVIATNTMHLLFDQLEQSSPIPLISILETTGRAIEARGFRVVGLLGSRFTMEKSFYAESLARRGIDSLIPDPADRKEIHRVIMEELGIGLLSDESRKRWLQIISRLRDRGAQGIVLGCTEIPLLIRPDDTSVPLFDTTVLHAEEALRYATTE